MKVIKDVIVFISSIPNTMFIGSKGEKQLSYKLVSKLEKLDELLETSNKNKTDIKSDCKQYDSYRGCYKEAVGLKCTCS